MHSRTCLERQTAEGNSPVGEMQVVPGMVPEYSRTREIRLETGRPTSQG